MDPAVEAAGMLSELPPEVLHLCFSHLSVGDLGRLEQTCRYGPWDI